MMKLKYYYCLIYMIPKFIFLLFNHLKERWNIDTKTLTNYLKSLIYAFFISLILDFIYTYYIIFDNMPFSQLKVLYFDPWTILYETFILSIFIYIKSYLEYDYSIKEIKYTLSNIKFIFTNYTSIIRKYRKIPRKNISSYNKYLEFKILNITIYQIFKFYFKNITYLESDYISKCVSGFSKLYKDKKSPEFKDFYTIIFFNPTKKDNLTHYQTLINKLKRQINILLKLNSLFVEENMIKELVEISLNQWYDDAIKYNT